MADAVKRDVKSGGISKDHAEADPNGLREGKAKKKKKTALKKLIVAEKEVRLQDKLAMPDTMPRFGQASAPFSAFSVDAPEFVPTGWVSSSAAAESAALDAERGAQAGGGANEGTSSERGHGEQRLRREDDARKRGPAVAMKAAPDFVPSWCQAQQPETGGDAISTSAPQANAFAEEELAVSKAIERMKAQAKEGQSKPAKVKQPKKPQAADFEVRHYVHQVLSDELDEKVKAMLGDLVRFQERAKERDPLKYQKQKRFCVGMREASRSVSRGKAKCLLMAPNLDISQAEGGLDDTVEDLIDLCVEHEVPVVFALSRNRMGKAVGKNIRMSIICVLSAEGVHQEFKQMIKLMEELRKQWVMRRMALGTHEEEASCEDDPGHISDAPTDGADAPNVNSTSISARVMRHLENKRTEEERTRAEEKVTRDAERAVEKERRAAERKVAQEERRAVQRAAAEARKQEEDAMAERLAEAERRKAAAQEEAQKRIEEARREKERKLEEERKLRAEREAAAAAAAGISEDEDTDEDLPMGFTADFF